MYNDPRITDRILMGLGRQNAPAVDTSAQQIIAEEAAREFANQKQAEDVMGRIRLNKRLGGMGLGLGKQRLDQSADQFQKGLEFAKQRQQENLGFEKSKFDTNYANLADELQQNRRLSDTAALISLGGLGVEGLRAYKGAQRSKEIQGQYDKMINFYKDQGTVQGRHVADLIKMLRIDQ